MDAVEALERIRGLARANRIRHTRHALQRMRERHVRPADVQIALANAHACQTRDGDRWEVTGEDEDGDELTLIVVIEDNLIIVTVY